MTKKFIASVRMSTIEIASNYFMQNLKPYFENLTKLQSITNTKEEELLYSVELVTPLTSVLQIVQYSSKEYFTIFATTEIRLTSADRQEFSLIVEEIKKAL